MGAEKQQLGELIQFHLRPKREAELLAELKEHEDAIDTIFNLLGHTALKEPLPIWPDVS